ncbi:MAG TPA: neutral/alkaline non-lysosomal ceramidase N-terminal domain-containing protein [Alloacidobacterium sp.]|nr:neutral/alkaline non-lysosomal ceramidase N-terminal domain-containing protein [Alloacidobacterium sp.]
MTQPSKADRVLLTVIIGFFLAAGFRANGAEMKAGVALVDITPPLGTHMWGYFDRLKGAEGVLDPLYARVLVLDDGVRRLAYIDLDLGRTFGPASLELLRRDAKKIGVDDLIVQATHTHAGPVIKDAYASGTPPWETAALVKIGQGIQQAREHVVTVRMGVGYGESYIGYNRVRVDSSNGQVTMIWGNASRAPTWPVDPTIAILRIDREDGQPLAILVNYAAHPVTFDSGMLMFSADFPGVMCKFVEQSYSSHPLAFFMQGAAGDINVYDAGTPVSQDAVGRRDWAGEKLGKAVVDITRKIDTLSEPDQRIDFDEEQLPFSLRWDPEKFRLQTIREMGTEAFQLFAPPIEKEIQLPVNTLLINRKIAFMTMPGEPFVEFQVNWRERCPVHDCFFMGYTNGYAGYFPSIEAGVAGGYGASSTSTWVELGAGEQMVNHAVIEVYKMLGRLENVPNANWHSLP